VIIHCRETLLWASMLRGKLGPGRAQQAWARCPLRAGVNAKFAAGAGYPPDEELKSPFPWRFRSLSISFSGKTVQTYQQWPPKPQPVPAGFFHPESLNLDRNRLPPFPWLPSRGGQSATSQPFGFQFAERMAPFLSPPPPGGKKGGRGGGFLRVKVAAPVRPMRVKRLFLSFQVHRPRPMCYECFYWSWQRRALHYRRRKALQTELHKE